MSLVELALIASSMAVACAALIGVVFYFKAVRSEYRAYSHVVLAFVFVIGVSVTGGIGLINDPLWAQAVRVVFNVIGMFAMLSLVARFRHPSVGDARRAARQDEELEELRDTLHVARAKAVDRIERKEP